MFLVLEDGNCLYVYDSADAATRSIEALDVGIIHAAFDDEARPYKVEWIRPNHYGKRLGPLTSCVNGEYRLVPAGEPDSAALVAVVNVAVAVIPPEKTGPLVELVRRLTGDLT